MGRTVEVLIEKPGRHDGQVGGKSPYLQAVHMQGGLSLIGTIASVTIISAGSNSLHGEWAGPEKMVATEAAA